MSTFNTCEKCGKYDFVATHKCLPTWLVYHQGWHGNGPDPEWEEASVIYARDAREAAEAYAEMSDGNGDYTIVGGSPATVLVRSRDDDESLVKCFEVEGEAVPSYRAREVKGAT